MSTVRIWDLPTRLFHWVLVLCVVGLVVTANIGGNAMVWHFRLGCTVLALLLFRIVWGLIGGHWSRFARFWPSPSRISAYLGGRATPEMTAGHNPLGALSVWAMLLFLSLQVGSGLMSDDDIAFAGPLTKFVSSSTVSLMTGYHKEVGKLILIVLIALHIGSIVYYKRKKNQNLVTPMLTGDKSMDVAVPASRDSAAQRVLALVTLAVCAAVAVWVYGLGG